MQIQKPTIGRVVIFTASNVETVIGSGIFDLGVERIDRVIKIDCYAGLITRAHDNGVIDIVTFGPTSTYHQLRVPFSAEGKSMTWDYPKHGAEKIEVQ